MLVVVKVIFVCFPRVEIRSKAFGIEFWDVDFVNESAEVWSLNVMFVSLQRL